MSSAGEGDVPMVEQPVEEPKPVVKEKKPNKAPKEKKKPKQSKTASHPPYFQMIKEALVGLNEKGGSSPYAIAKYMEEKHKSVLPANFRKMLGLQLKNQAARGKLIKIKASYKLSSEAAKKETRSTRAKKAIKASVGTKKTERAKKGGRAVKKTRKSSTPAKPKSIRTPSKRARKATASA